MNELTLPRPVANREEQQCAQCEPYHPQSLMARAAFERVGIHIHDREVDDAPLLARWERAIA
jgi:hypothetical protein